MHNTCRSAEKVVVAYFCTCMQSAVEKSFKRSFTERGEELMARNSIDGSGSVVSTHVLL